MKLLIVLAALLCAVPATAFDLILFAPRPPSPIGGLLQTDGTSRLMLVNGTDALRKARG